jgi:hypothetical protein
VRWYQPTECSNTVSNPYVADEGDVGVDESKLRCGEEVGAWSPSAWIRASTPEQDGDPDDVLQSYLGVPVFSARLRTALRESGIEDVQYLPLRVLRPSGEELRGFAVANITTVRDVLDRERSDYSVFADDYFLPQRRGQISALRKPVLVKASLSGCDLFRIEGYRVAYFVSERVKDVFEHRGFTGLSFREVALT